MRKTFVLLMVVFLIITSSLPCSAEKVYYTTKNTDVSEVVENLNTDYAIRLRGNSKKYSFNYEFSFNENNLDEQKEAVKTFLDEVIKLSKGKQDDYKINGGYDGYNNVAVCEIKESGFTRYSFTLKDKHITFDFGAFDLETSDVLMEYLSKSDEQVLSSLDHDNAKDKSVQEQYTIDLEKNLIGKEEFKRIEKVEFDVTIDESFSGTIFEEISDINSNVHCSIENIFLDGTRLILTLEGEKGKKQFFEKLYGFESVSGDKLYFTVDNQIRDNIAVIDNSVKLDTIYFEGNFSNKELKNIAMYLSPYGQPFKIKDTNKVFTQNVNYECYEPDGKKVLNSLLGIKDKNEVIEEAQKDKEKYDVEEQDPERYVTQVKGVMKSGRVHDYSISFIAEIPLNTNNRNLPDWYSKLGNDVTATLVGFTQIVDGKENSNYTMIRFSGSKDTIWFHNADTIPMKEENGTILVDNSYVSLISFDGRERIYNSVEHETLDTKITFSNDENMELLNIAIKIGTKTISTDSKNVKYIGGGKATYEKLF